MSSSQAELPIAQAQRVSITDDSLIVDIVDGRSVTVPLAWYPRLAHATPTERQDWRLIGGGVGVHWPQLDEDISVEALLAGRPSGESQASLERWLTKRQAG